MKQPRISIVTPCLNAIATIEETLSSVEAQGYPDVQHLVIDGGSTDGTLELLRSGRWDVEVHSGPDQGLSDALNKGLRLATGAVVGWLNADDIYLPGALQAVADAHLADPAAAWITGHCRIIDAESREIRAGVTRYKSALLRRYRYSTLLMQNYISAPATFLATDRLADIGEARLDQRYSMDYDLWLRAGRISPPAIIDRQIAAFRMAPGTLSMTGFRDQFREHAAISWAHANGAERLASGVNQVLSRGIVATYRLMAWRRARASSGRQDGGAA